MKSVLAIAGIAIRSAFRSRVVLSLFAMLLAIIVFLPMTIRSDGTMQGTIQIMLRYALGLSFGILSLSGLWSGCAAVAGEIESRTLHLVVTKPVRSLSIWLGKWLGIFLLHGSLLVICSSISTALLWHRLDREIEASGQTVSVRDLLYVHREVQPDEPSVLPEARNRLREEIAAQQVPGDVSPDQRLRELIQQLQLERNAVSRSGVRQWNLPLPPASRTDLSPRLVYRMSSSNVGAEPIPGRWILRDTNGTALMDIEQEGIPTAVNQIDLPPELLAGRGQITLEYINSGDRPVTVIFHPADGLILQIPAADFPWNLARSLVLMLGQLGFFIAAGLTAGTLFSFPVAAFLSLYLMIMIRTAGYIQGMANRVVATPWSDQPEAAGSWGTYLLTGIYRILAALVQPMTGHDPLQALALGRLISTRWLIDAVLIQGVGLCGLLALVTSFALSRKEIGLPGQ